MAADDDRGPTPARRPGSTEDVNHLVVMLSQAMLGSVGPELLAAALDADDHTVRLYFAVTETSDAVLVDIDDIVGELTAFVLPDRREITVDVVEGLDDTWAGSPARWVFAAKGAGGAVAGRRKPSVAARSASVLGVLGVLDGAPDAFKRLGRALADRGFRVTRHQTGGTGGAHLVFEGTVEGVAVGVELAAKRGQWQVGVCAGSVGRPQDPRVWEAYLDGVPIGRPDRSQEATWVVANLDSIARAGGEADDLQGELTAIGEAYMRSQLRD